MSLQQKGSLCTCLLARDTINSNMPLTIYTLDVLFEPVFDPDTIDNKFDGYILGFKANSPNHSYMQMSNKYVTNIAEKLVISDIAAVGVYFFKHGNTFVQYADKMIEKQMKSLGEYYINPLYNLYIKDGLKIGCHNVNKIHVMGTPDELTFFTKYVLRKFGSKPIALCSDHSGFETKEYVKDILTDMGFTWIDFGTYIKKDCDYHDYVSQATRYVLDENGFGIGFCSTGQGVNIAANKIPGIMSALVYDVRSAKYAVKHNCANFFSIPTNKKSQIKSILQNIASNTFDGGRHATRIRKIIYEGK